jgi:hypothetical protein
MRSRSPGGVLVCPRRCARTRALRQVLAAAVRWRWIDHSVATPGRTSGRSRESWVRTARSSSSASANGVRPEEAFGADWTAIDLQAGVFTVHRAFAAA